MDDLVQGVFDQVEQEMGSDDSMQPALEGPPIHTRYRMIAWDQGELDVEAKAAG